MCESVTDRFVALKSHRPKCTGPYLQQLNGLQKAYPQPSVVYSNIHLSSVLHDGYGRSIDAGGDFSDSHCVEHLESLFSSSCWSVPLVQWGLNGMLSSVREHPDQFIGGGQPRTLYQRGHWYRLLTASLPRRLGTSRLGVGFSQQGTPDNGSQYAVDQEAWSLTEVVIERLAQQDRGACARRGTAEQDVTDWLRFRWC